MSCFVKITTRLTDLERIRAAAERLGYPVLASKTVRGWSENETQADLVLGTKTSYDIGVVRDETGAVAFVCDWDMSRINRKGFVEEMSQTYGVLQVMEAARKKGFSVAQEQVDETGNVRLMLRKFI